MGVWYNESRWVGPSSVLDKDFPMAKMLLDATVRGKLQGLDQAELCDESGHTVGRFLSEDLYRRLIYDWANPSL